MKIDDDELRAIFKTASEEHLQKLDDGLLYLEKHLDDEDCLATLMREAHSLKGDAGMVGVKDIATLAHQMESILGRLSRHETTLSPDLSDRLAQGLDAIRKLVHEAVTGEPAGINTFQVLAHLMGAKPANAPEGTLPSRENAHETEPDTDSVPPTASLLPALDMETATRGASLESERSERRDRSPLPLSQSSLSSHPNASIAPNPPPTLERQELTTATQHEPRSTYRIETIRVETRDLDSLMNQTGELTVTKIRIAHRLAEIEAMMTLWEEWSRDTLLHRFILSDLMAQNGTAHHPDKNLALQQLQNFYERAETHLEQLGTQIDRLRSEFYEDVTRLDNVATELETGIQTLRLLPLSAIFQLFPRLVRNLARDQGKTVDLIIEGGETLADKRILEEMKDPLTHLIRNAIDHGIERPEERQQLGKSPTATLYLRGSQTATGIAIEVSDDGRGLDLEKIKQTAQKRQLYREEELATMSPKQIQSLIFAPGFSTRTFVTELSGRGIGLDVVHLNVEKLKGTIQVESTPNAGCIFRIQLGTTLTTAHVLLVVIEGTTYALPVEAVQMARLIPRSDIFPLEGRDTAIIDNEPVSLVLLADLLELSPALSGQSMPADRQLSCILLKLDEERLGLIVDTLLDEQDVVLKPQSKLLKRVRNVSGATILGTGEVCMVLNPSDLIQSARKRTIVAPPTTSVEPIAQRPTILLVEDSIAIRTQEKRILEGAGYEVVTAVDGLDGLKKLKTRSFDAVISDVQMPNLDGLSLTTQIRQDTTYRELPIILVTSLETAADRKRGAEAGANAYITKGAFNQDILLETLKRLV